MLARYLEFRTMDEVHKSSDSECYALLSKTLGAILEQFNFNFEWRVILTLILCSSLSNS
jgi:hypothetical protein